MDEKKVREEEYLEFPWGVEDTIENLRELKTILQQQVREADCDGKGVQDAFEIGFDFDRAIEALEKQLPKKPKEEKGAYTHKIGEFRIGKCPKCEAEVSDRFGGCLDCGQCLDWNWEKE